MVKMIILEQSLAHFQAITRNDSNELFIKILFDHFFDDIGSM